MKLHIYHLAQRFTKHLWVEHLPFSTKIHQAPLSRAFTIWYKDLPVLFAIFRRLWAEHLPFGTKIYQAPLSRAFTIRYKDLPVLFAIFRHLWAEHLPFSTKIHQAPLSRVFTIWYKDSPGTFEQSIYHLVQRFTRHIWAEHLPFGTKIYQSCSPFSGTFEGATAGARSPRAILNFAIQMIHLSIQDKQQIYALNKEQIILCMLKKKNGNRNWFSQTVHYLSLAWCQLDVLNLFWIE